MSRPDPIDYSSVAKWTAALIESNPSMTVVDFDKEARAQGVTTGRGPYYSAVREYRAKHGLGKLPRGGKNNPRAANHGKRVPARKVVQAPENKEERYTPKGSRLKRELKQEINEHIVKLLLWMGKYNVRVVTIEHESQEVTLSNEPSLSRQLVPSPHFTVQGD